MTRHIRTLESDLAMRRAQAANPSMFFRMLVRAAVLRRGRAVAALCAVIVAAAAVTAVLDLYVDVQAKLQREFQNYGANIIVAGKEGGSLPNDALRTVNMTLAEHGIAMPVALVVARTKDGQPIVAVGVDFERVQQLDRWWSVSKWPSMSGEALVGVRAQSALPRIEGPFDLSFSGKSIRLVQVGTVGTGAGEDSRVYLSLTDFVSWTGIQPSMIEVAATGTPQEINATMEKLAKAVPVAEVRPVRQIVEGEALVLGKTRSTLLVASVLIVITAFLCVCSTLMGWVFDRRRDFAIMKALGASGRLLNGFFAAEAGALGAVGAIAGFAAGIAIADWIGRVNFHAAVIPRFTVLPIILAGSIAVTLLSAILPIWLLGRVQPAEILRGE